MFWFIEYSREDLGTERHIGKFEGFVPSQAVKSLQRSLPNSLNILKIHSTAPVPPTN